MAEGIKDGKAHKEPFQAFNNGLEELQEVDVAVWWEWVDKWEKELHVEEEKESLYKYVEEGVMLKEIQEMIAAKEYLQAGDRTEVEREDTLSTFIMMEMDIEESQ
ncbi:hypothetical protein MVEN_01611000 [Mycena venus]|uniref:Uncharacterized protein n=1 Tax=Mycena venus TaxID=2733690 RepID=A0A8H6XT84_9AGAR|nr:hypothetical protein MVEN_01611000 [Mycena venus]